MNKSQLIDKIAAGADISKAAAGRALDSMIDAVTDALKKDDQVALVGFGTFSVRLVLVVTLKRVRLSRSLLLKYLLLKQVKH